MDLRLASRLTLAALGFLAGMNQETYLPPPSVSSADGARIVLDVAEQHRTMFFGEVHYASGVLAQHQFVADLLSELHAKGYTHLALEIDKDYPYMDALFQEEGWSVLVQTVCVFGHVRI